MDIIQFATSLSKVSIFSFIVITAFLAYEVWQLVKERKSKSKPTVPQFNATANQNLTQTTIITQPHAQRKSSGFSHGYMVAILIIVLFALTGYTVYSAYLSSQAVFKQKPAPKVIVREVQSKGIKIFNRDWKELRNVDTLDLKGGDTIICGVETLKDLDIDRARIRLNKNTWDIDDITTKFNSGYNVFYKEFTIATGEPKLQFEAQLHSAKDGWLGE